VPSTRFPKWDSMRCSIC